MLHRYVVANEGLETAHFDYLEFGVSKGGSFRFWLDNCKSPYARFYGFDSFTGIPEDWGSVKKGTYSTDGKLPDVMDDRATFIVGLFSDTLVDFTRTTNLSRRKVIHLDADLYSSTLYALIHLHPYLKKDDIIVFDEFFSITKADHEFRAFLDYLAIHPLHYMPIAKSSTQLAIRVL
jgi:hypothetical protein